jgi:hypothetical protein
MADWLTSCARLFRSSRSARRGSWSLPEIFVVTLIGSILVLLITPSFQSDRSGLRAAAAGSGGGAVGKWGSRYTPRTPQITSAPANPTVDTAATFHFSSKGRTRGYKCRLDGRPFSPCTSPITYTGLGVGVHAFEVVALAGEIRSPSAHWVWSIEPRASTAPATPVIQSGPASRTDSPAATFSFASPTPGVSYLCRLDGKPFASCTSPKSYSSLAPGRHRFDVKVKARDAAGLESGVASFTWRIETGTVAKKPPLTPTIHVGPTSVTNSTNARIEFASASPGVTYRCRLDGTSFAPCTSPATYTTAGTASR